MFENFNLNHAVNALATAVSIPTVSGNSIQNYQPFDNFIVFLEKTWPECFKYMEYTHINNYGLILRLKGKNREANPLLFTAHYDVLPVLNGEKWTHNPFDQTIYNGSVWGRGASSSKLTVVVLFEALSRFISSQTQPERDIYIALGFDQYAGGSLGAARIASFFQSQHLHFSAIISDGSGILPPSSPLFNRPLALIGIAQPDFVRLKIRSTVSSACNPIETLSSFITYLQKNPLSAPLSPISQLFLKKISTDITGRQRYYFDHPKHFKKSLYKILYTNPLTRAMVQNTFYPVDFSIKGSGISSPEEASVILHGRLMTDYATAVNYLQQFSNDAPLKIELLSHIPATPVSSTRTDAFTHLKACISVIYPEAEPVPYTLLTQNDACHYTDLSDAIYYFSPVTKNADHFVYSDRKNEHIAFETIQKAIDFYTTFIQNYQ